MRRRLALTGAVAAALAAWPLAAQVLQQPTPWYGPQAGPTAQPPTAQPGMPLMPPALAPQPIAPGLPPTPGVQPPQPLRLSPEAVRQNRQAILRDLQIMLAAMQEISQGTADTRLRNATVKAIRRIQHAMTMVPKIDDEDPRLVIRALARAQQGHQQVLRLAERVQAEAAGAGQQLAQLPGEGIPIVPGALPPMAVGGPQEVLQRAQRNLQTAYLYLQRAADLRGPRATEQATRAVNTALVAMDELEGPLNRLRAQAPSPAARTAVAQVLTEMHGARMNLRTLDLNSPQPALQAIRDVQQAVEEVENMVAPGIAQAPPAAGHEGIAPGAPGGGQQVAEILEPREEVETGVTQPGVQGASVPPAPPADAIGQTVRTPAGDELGELSEIIYGPGGQPRAAVLDVGGFLGIGERPVAVPWSRLDVSADAENVVLPMTREELEALPEFRGR